MSNKTKKVVETLVAEVPEGSAAEIAAAIIARSKAKADLPEPEVKITPMVMGGPNAAALAKVLAHAAKIVKEPKKGKRSTPKPCLCECGGMTKGGNYLPGHDAKVLSREVERLRKMQEELQTKVA